MEPWVAGIVTTIVLGLIATIWRTNSRSIDIIERRIDDAEIEVQNISQSIVEHSGHISAIKDNCSRCKESTMSEPGFRNILREELRDFEVRIKAELTNSIKLELIENGYISPVKPARKRNVEKA